MLMVVWSQHHLLVEMGTPVMFLSWLLEQLFFWFHF